MEKRIQGGIISRATQPNLMKKTKGLRARLKSNAFWSAANLFIGRASFFIANIYLARILGAEQYGLLVLAQTIVSYFWLGVDLGTNMYGIRQIARDKENSAELINSLSTMRFIAGLVLFVIFTSSIFLFPQTKDTRHDVFIFAGLYLISFACVGDWILKGYELFKEVTICSFLSSVTFLLSICILVTNKNHVQIAAFLWASSFLVGAIYIWIILQGKTGVTIRPKVDFSNWIFHLRKSLYFTGAGLLAQLSQTFPVILIAMAGNSIDVGIFSAPYRIVLTITMLGILVPSAVYPILSETYVRDKIRFSRLQKKLFKFMVSIGTILLLLFPFSQTIITTLFGEQYTDSVELFRVLIFLVPLILIRTSFGIPLLAMGLERLRMITSLIVALLSISISFVFLHIFGLIGLCGSLVAAELIGVLLLSFIYIKKMTIGCSDVI
jgi:O-antigen/teichoic acid export membrane protein